ncbi:hypothetical protein MMC22_010763 [Lobaria immixta]|nr:hypothetical protein [Lobaria immixta]
MYFPIVIASLLTITASLRTASALGINCAGSFWCQTLTTKPISLAEFLHNAVVISKKDPSTIYRDHEHITCVSLDETYEYMEGFCLFPQGADLTLAQIRPLFDALLAFNCKTCGSVPIHFVDRKSNDPRWGILTLNYVRSAHCAGNCIPGRAPVGTLSKFHVGTALALA